MKNAFRLLILVASSVASTAFACPNLSGTFSCPADSTLPATIWNISQHVENGVTVYSMHETDMNGNIFMSGDYIADGVVRLVPNGSGGDKMSMSFTCEGDTALREYERASESLGNMEVMTDYALNGQGNIHIMMEITVPSIGTEKADQICVRP